MEETIKRYYNIDKNLEIAVEVASNPYNIPPEFLFNMAARKNLKREFLFVSKVIGKHLPMVPITLELIGAILARSWIKGREGRSLPDTLILVEVFKKIQAGAWVSSEEMKIIKSIIATPIALKHKTLFIGFAETATGLAQAVFNSFSNAAYIHTTREAINTVTASVLFQEEHSHAVEHQLYPLDPELLNNFQDIVLVDDELTTGKTALNLIKKLKGTSFGVISILDWREKEAEELYENYRDKKLQVCSLIKGNIAEKKTGETKALDKVGSVEVSKPASYREIIYGEGSYLENYLIQGGRFGISSEQQHNFKKSLKGIAKELKSLRNGGNCLCLGWEEFIYIPCVISEELGEKVYFQSSTRSPIYAKDIANYAITGKVSFTTSEDCETQKFLYNIPKDFYEQVILFTEKPLKEEKKQELIGIFNGYNIADFIFVSFSEGGRIIE